jgi:Sortase domain
VRTSRIHRSLIAACLSVVGLLAGCSTSSNGHGSPAGGQSASRLPTASPSSPQPPAAASGTAKPSNSSSAPAAGVPVRITVAGHNLAAPIEAHPTIDGGLYIPPDPTRVSWSSNDPRPGDPYGTIILTSHVNYVINGSNVLGAFHDLPNYQPGDKITLTLDSGRQLTYQVVRNESYSKAYLAAHPTMWPALFNETPNYHPSLGPGHPASAALKLTTCSGPFEASDGNYLNNSFVTAYLV